MQQKHIDVGKRLWEFDDDEWVSEAPQSSQSTLAPEKQVKSKERVEDHGEVLTQQKEVNAMLDLVKAETESIDSRFLEPACGTGNFLAEVLERKLAVVKRRYHRSQLEYERNAVLAVSSIYGIDILVDNVRECQMRLFDVFDREYSALFKNRAKKSCREAAKIILARNILWGNALTLMAVSDPPTPIVFSEWSFPFHDSRIQRRDFMFSELLPPESTKSLTGSLFARDELISDSGVRAFIPKEMRTEAPIHFSKLEHAHG